MTDGLLAVVESGEVDGGEMDIGARRHLLVF